MTKLLAQFVPLTRENSGLGGGLDFVSGERADSKAHHSQLCFKRAPVQVILSRIAWTANQTRHPADTLDRG